MICAGLGWDSATVLTSSMALSHKSGQNRLFLILHPQALDVEDVPAGGSSLSKGLITRASQECLGSTRSVPGVSQSGVWLLGAMSCRESAGPLFVVLTSVWGQNVTCLLGPSLTRKEQKS